MTTLPTKVEVWFCLAIYVLDLIILRKDLISIIMQFVVQPLGFFNLFVGYFYDIDVSSCTYLTILYSSFYTHLMRGAVNTTTMLYMSSCMGMGFLYSHKAMPSYVGPLGLVVFPVSSCMHCHEVITYKQKHLCFVQSQPYTNMYRQTHHIYMVVITWPSSQSFYVQPLIYIGL